MTRDQVVTCSNNHNYIGEQLGDQQRLDGQVPQQNAANGAGCVLARAHRFAQVRKSWRLLLAESHRLAQRPAVEPDRVLQVPVANHTVENFPQRYVRLGGVLYLAIIVLGAFAEGFVANKLIASGDAATAAHNILASPGCGASASPAT
jgi:hypothetical protein